MAIVFNNVFFDDINGVSFEIEEGKITGILGSCGSGKSTLTDLMAGLVYPTSGNVLLSNSVSVVFQDLEDQFYFDRILDNFNFVLRGKCDAQKRIIDSLKMLGLDVSYLYRNPYTLSLSEVKKVSLAIALSVNPKILILDDIFDGLDMKDTNMIINIISIMRIRYGKTIVVLSRNSDIIYRICDRVIVMKDGHVLINDDKYSFFKNQYFNKSGVLLPKFVKFLDYVREKGQDGIIYRCDVDDLAKDIYRWMR